MRVYRKRHPFGERNVCAEDGRRNFPFLYGNRNVAERKIYAEHRKEFRAFYADGKGIFLFRKGEHRLQLVAEQGIDQKIDDGGNIRFRLGNGEIFGDQLCDVFYVAHYFDAVEVDVNAPLRITDMYRLLNARLVDCNGNFTDKGKFFDVDLNVRVERESLPFVCRADGKNVFGKQIDKRVCIRNEVDIFRLFLFRQSGKFFFALRKGCRQRKVFRQIDVRFYVVEGNSLFRAVKCKFKGKRKSQKFDGRRDGRARFVKEEFSAAKLRHQFVRIDCNRFAESLFGKDGCKQFGYPLNGKASLQVAVRKVYGVPFQPHVQILNLRAEDEVGHIRRVYVYDAAYRRFV